MNLDAIIAAAVASVAAAKYFLMNVYSRFIYFLKSYRQFRLFHLLNLIIFVLLHNNGQAQKKQKQRP